MEYEVLYWFDELAQMWGVTVPDLPGCGSEGMTRADAEANIAEAIRLHIDVLREAGESVPAPARYQLGSIAV